MRSSPIELVERDAQLAALRESAAAAAAGTGRIVLVSGEAGIGKTSLLGAFVAGQSRAAVWWGACEALCTPTPLAPLHDIARTANVGFAALLAAQAAPGLLFNAVIEELQSAGPVIAVIEDAHWADESTLDLLLFLGRRIDRTSALLLVTFREDELSLKHPLRAIIGELPAALTERIALPRLSEEAVATLARNALRSPAGIHATSGGNPFFVVELLQHGSTQPPRSVQDLVLGRLARLPAGAREIVQLVSIVPGRTERWLVEQLLHPSAEALEACLDSGLLLVQDAWFQFRHELARVAVEGAVATPIAEMLHGRALDALLAQDGNPCGLTRLVHHAVRAGRKQAVSELAPAAAKDARARGARREAAAHYRTALEYGGGMSPEDRAALLEAYAVECQATHQIAEAIRAREEAAVVMEAGRDVVGQARNLSQLALTYVVALRNADADESSRRAISMLEALPPSRQLAHAYRVEAHLRMLNRDNEDAVAWGRKAIALAERFEDREVLAAALGTVGAAIALRDYWTGYDSLMQALHIAQENGFDYIVANTYCNLGNAAGEMYELRTAERYLQSAIEYSATKEVDLYRTYAMAWLALCHVYLGKWDEAELHALEALGCAAESSTARVMALCALGRLRARRGDAGVDDVLDEALELALLTGTLQRIAPVRAARAEAAFLRGDFGKVLREASAALPLAVEKGHAGHVGELSYWLWRVDARRPAEPCADPYALALAGAWQESADAWAELQCPYEEARALAAGGDEAKIRALQQFDRMGARPAADALRSELRERGVKGMRRGPRASTLRNPRGLTARELQILEYLCQGLRNSEIAERLYRSVRTVEHHVDSILGKLEARSRSEVVAIARREKLLPKMGIDIGQNA